MKLAAEGPKESERWCEKNKLTEKSDFKTTESVSPASRSVLNRAVDSQVDPAVIELEHLVCVTCYHLLSVQGYLHLVITESYLQLSTCDDIRLLKQ